MMKTIVLNASPRKNWNTAKLLRSAADGAAKAGADVEYINLYDLNYTGCRSCMLCKRKGAERCHCYIKDDLSPVIDRIFAADALFIGTPIFLGRPTSQYFALIERLPSISWSRALPISCNSPARRASFSSAPSSAAIRPAI